jgi:hypothetical protein
MRVWRKTAVSPLAKPKRKIGAMTPKRFMEDIPVVRFISRRGVGINTGRGMFVPLPPEPAS